MLRKKLWVLAGLILLLNGCAAAGDAKAPSSPPTARPSDFGGGDAQFPAKSAPAAPPPQAGASAEASAQPSTSRRASADEPRASRTPAERPGLGTEWGESRTSRVHDVSFVRESSRPFAIATLNYNDRRGVDALAARHAGRDTSRGFDAAGGAVTVSLRDAGGDPLEALHVGGRTFVVGQAGQRYTIVLQNHTSHRFEAVGTVDGLDVINGKPGTFDNRGYVLMPFTTLEIEGFRQSTSSVATFRFGSVGESYAAQTGSARNVGVIGVALFGERGDTFVPDSETRTRDSASPFPADTRFAQPPRR